MQRNSRLGILNANAIKIIAAIFMTVDHVGLVLFPEVQILRIIGRLSMPLFSFMIAEGARYTRNKIRYFLIIFLLGSAFQGVYYAIEGALYLGILITFSISILLIYSLQLLKKKLANGGSEEALFAFLLFSLAVATTYFLNESFAIDYGFWGCMLPVFAAIFHQVGNESEINHGIFKILPLEYLSFAAGLVALCVSYGGIQYFALLSLLILFFYSGKRGRLNLKYFFYIFYPLHLLIIYAIYEILNGYGIPLL